MNEVVTKLNKNIQRAADKAELLTAKLMKATLIVIIIAAILSPGAAAYADEGVEGATIIVDVFTDIVALGIKILYGLSALLVAFGVVKSGVSAQAAQAFGATHKVSYEMMNIVGSIVIFIIALLGLPLVNMLIDKVHTSIGMDPDSLNIHNPYR